MRIAFSPTIFRMQSEGGISRYFYQLIRGIISKGHDVYVGDHAIRGKYLELLLECNISSETKYERKVGTLFLDPRWPLTWNPKSLTKWKPDIIHETYYSTKWFTKDFKSTKKVLTVYDLIAEKYANTPLKRSYKSQALGLIDHAICISSTTQSDLINLYNFDFKKSSVIYLADFPLPEITNTSLQESVKKYCPFFLYVGERRGYKNFDLLINAFADFSRNNPSYELVAFGGGVFSNSELQMLSHKSLLKRVRQLSGDDELLSILYRSAEALIYPSIMEGFGMPPIESITAGTPVISSKNSATIEVLGPKNALFFENNSVADLRSQMEIISNHKYDILSMMQRAKIRVKSYSWERCINETIKLYLSLL